MELIHVPKSYARRSVNISSLLKHSGLIITLNCRIVIAMLIFLFTVRIVLWWLCCRWWWSILMAGDTISGLGCKLTWCFFMTTEEIWRFRCYFCMSQQWNVSTRRPELILCCKLQVACCRAPCSSINRIIFWCLSVTWLSPFLTPAKLKLLCFFLTAARQWWAQHFTRLNLNKHRDVGS